MRNPPIAALLLFVAAGIPAGSGLIAAGPGTSAGVAIEVGADSMPGYYPTWQTSQPSANAPVNGAPSTEVPGYSRAGWETGGATMQYRPDLGTETAPLISPYLLRNEMAPGGGPTIGHRADDFLAPFVPQGAAYYDSNGRAVTTINANLGMYLQRDLDLEASQIKAGPLYIHFTQLDAVALYSDITGPYAKQLPDDGFIAAVSLTFELSLRLAPRTALEVQGTVYYIPTNNRFGFYSSAASMTYAHFEHTIEIDRWDITFYDYLDVITPLSYLLQYGANGSVFDRSGLYTVGYLSHGFERSFNGDNLFFRNSVGVRASTYLQSDLRFTAGYQHADIWLGNGFKYQGSLDQFNAGLFYEPKDLWFMPWTTYDAYLYDNFRSNLQQWYVGATLPISRDILGYARVGWAWEGGDAGRGFDDGSLVWDVGVNHQIDRQWSQSAVFGNSYRISPLLEQTHGMYATYGLNFHSAYSTLIAGATATWAHESPSGADNEVYTLYTGCNLDELTSVRGTVMYAPADFAGGNRQVWLYQAELDRVLTPTLMLKFIYQLTDYHTTQVGGTYIDNMLMLTLTKRL